MAHTVYRVNGQRVPSVTTILGKFKDPGPLMYWANQEAYKVLEEANHLLNRAEEEVASGVNGHSFFSEGLNDDLNRYWRSEPLVRANFRSSSTRAAEAGTAAHSLVEGWIQGTEDEKSKLEGLDASDVQAGFGMSKKQGEQALKSFQAFLKWSKGHRFILRETELQLTSEDYAYGGTIDCIGTLDGEWCIADWKTSKAVYVDYVLQLAAYGNLWNENWEPEIKTFHLLRFDKETADFHHFSFSDLSAAFEMFVLLREAYELQKEVGKLVK